MSGHDVSQAVGSVAMLALLAASFFLASHLLTP